MRAPLVPFCARTAHTHYKCSTVVSALKLYTVSALTCAQTVYTADYTNSAQVSEVKVYTFGAPNCSLTLYSVRQLTWALLLYNIFVVCRISAHFCALPVYIVLRLVH